MCAALALLAGCGETPKAKKAKEPEKPADPVTGRYAFHQVYITARTWGTDLQGLRVVPLRVGSRSAPPGKSFAWEVTFVSPSRAKQRTYIYSVVEEGSILKGTLAGIEDNYMQRGQARPWNTQALKIDSDTAYETALKKSEAYVKKNPDMPVTFLLEQTARHPELTWRVIWGTSVSTSNYSVYVGASSGLYLETMR